MDRRASREAGCRKLLTNEMPNQRNEQTMAQIKIIMKSTGEPVKRIPLTIRLDDGDKTEIKTQTNRIGVVQIEHLQGSGSILIGGRSHYQGNLDKDILVELW